jgi:hypothetical protein
MQYHCRPRPRCASRLSCLSPIPAPPRLPVFIPSPSTRHRGPGPRISDWRLPWRLPHRCARPPPLRVLSCSKQPFTSLQEQPLRHALRAVASILWAASGRFRPAAASPLRAPHHGRPPPPFTTTTTPPPPGHLVGQFPGRFRCAGLRNPVLNISFMIGQTDIPDWCYIETLGTEVRGDTNRRPRGGQGRRGPRGGRGFYSWRLVEPPHAAPISFLRSHILLH